MFQSKNEYISLIQVFFTTDALKNNALKVTSDASSDKDACIPHSLKQWTNLCTCKKEKRRF